MTETTQSCPECKDTRIRRRNGKNECIVHAPGKKWYCSSCGHTFNEPLLREKDQDKTRTGMAKQLLEMDPDEVPGGAD
jgi:transposase-like protein